MWDCCHADAFGSSLCTQWIEKVEDGAHGSNDEDSELSFIPVSEDKAKELKMRSPATFQDLTDFIIVEKHNNPVNSIVRGIVGEKNKSFLAKQSLALKRFRKEFFSLIGSLLMFHHSHRRR